MHNCRYVHSREPSLYRLYHSIYNPYIKRRYRLRCKRLLSYCANCWSMHTRLCSYIHGHFCRFTHVHCCRCCHFYSCHRYLQHNCGQSRYVRFNRLPLPNDCVELECRNGQCSFSSCRYCGWLHNSGFLKHSCYSCYVYCRMRGNLFCYHTGSGHLPNVETYVDNSKLRRSVHYQLECLRLFCYFDSYQRKQRTVFSNPTCWYDVRASM